MIYVTGDAHGEFGRIEAFCRSNQTSRKDTMIVLGDAGINYYNSPRSHVLKRYLSELPITFFCIHGNHEKRPQNIATYKQKVWCGGTTFVEDNFPSLLFAEDGEVYDLDGNHCIAIGGAYSVDKIWRIERGYGWWADEQPSSLVKRQVEDKLAARGNKIDIVLSHTCPYKYLPREVFLAGIDQSTVDASTETWLDTIEEKTDYMRWYCGHYHTEKSIDKILFLFEGVRELGR